MHIFQLIMENTEGPWYQVPSIGIKTLLKTWTWMEIVKLKTGIQKFTIPLSSKWNKFDFCMIVLAWVWHFMCHFGSYATY